MRDKPADLHPAAPVGASRTAAPLHPSDQDRSADLLEMSHATMNNRGNRLLVCDNKYFEMF